MKVKIISAILLCFASALNLSAQATRKVGKAVLYVKSSEMGKGNMEICTLCKDKGLKDHCTLYVYDNGVKIGTPVLLTEKQLKDLVAGNSPSSVSGLKYFKTSKAEYYTYEANGATTAIFNSPSGIVISTEDVPADDPRFAMHADRLKALDDILAQCLSGDAKRGNKHDHEARCRKEYSDDVASLGFANMMQIGGGTIKNYDISKKPMVIGGATIPTKK